MKTLSFFVSSINGTIIVILALVFIFCSCEKSDTPVSPTPVVKTVTDIDGNVYNTVQIGTQEWIVDNLKVTHYRNGDPIPNVSDGSTWINLSTGAYCNYMDDPNNASIYGRLYNWFAVDDPRGLAPEGWHVASDAEWETLVNYLGGDSIAGGALKDTILWQAPNAGTTNSSGFSALPGGSRGMGSGFGYKGYCSYFWSSTEYSTDAAWYRLLGYYNAHVARWYFGKDYGFSVRCVRD